MTLNFMLPTLHILICIRVAFNDVCLQIWISLFYLCHYCTFVSKTFFWSFVYVYSTTHNLTSSERIVLSHYFGKMCLSVIFDLFFVAEVYHSPKLLVETEFGISEQSHYRECCTVTDDIFVST